VAGRRRGEHRTPPESSRRDWNEHNGGGPDRHRSEEPPPDLRIEAGMERWRLDRNPSSRFIERDPGCDPARNDECPERDRSDCERGRKRVQPVTRRLAQRDGAGHDTNLPTRRAIHGVAREEFRNS
jgi:hypothetical protein